MPEQHWPRPGGWVVPACLAGGLLLAAGMGVAIWGVLIEPRLLQQRTVHAQVPNLPPAWQGQRLALLADLQVGAPLANVDTVRRAVQRAVAAQPAAVLLAGDYVYNASSDPDRIITQLLDLFQPLAAARMPSLGVLGNHDFAGESTPDPHRQQALADAVEAALEQAGIRILRNQAVPLRAGQDALYVVGLGEHAVDQDDWRAAFAQVPPDAARVVLAHDPRALQPIPSGWAPLALAGHTHGGQIRVPTRPDWAPARWFMPWPEYVDGWIGGFLQPGNRLYVNRGIGFSKLPVRLGAPPELTLVTLHPAPPGQAATGMRRAPSQAEDL